jgi:hypothetical protein
MRLDMTGIYTVIVLLPASVLLIVLAAAIRALRVTVAAGPIEFKSFDPGYLSPAVQDRLKSISAQLTELGFRSIGDCEKYSSDEVIGAYSVWVREDVIVEICVVRKRYETAAGIVVAFGQEYMDGSAIVIRNTNRTTTIGGQQQFFLAGLRDMTIINNISQLIIAQHRAGRLPWTPSNAVEYKRRDIELWRENVVRDGYYRLDLRKNCYRPTLKHLRLKWLTAIKKASVFSNENEDYETTNYWLKQAGYPDQRRIIAPRLRAFPVITDSAQQNDS